MLTPQQTWDIARALHAALSGIEDSEQAWMSLSADERSRYENAVGVVAPIITARVEVAVVGECEKQIAQANSEQGMSSCPPQKRNELAGRKEAFAEVLKVLGKGPQ